MLFVVLATWEKTEVMEDITIYGTFKSRNEALAWVRTNAARALIYTIKVVCVP